MICGACPEGCMSEWFLVFVRLFVGTDARVVQQDTIKRGDFESLEGALNECSISKQDEQYEEDHADVCFLVANEKFRCHRFVLGARSEYFKARFSRATEFSEGVAASRGIDSGVDCLPVLQEYDLSPTAFQKVLEYM